MRCTHAGCAGHALRVCMERRMVALEPGMGGVEPADTRERMEGCLTWRYAPPSGSCGR